MDDSKCSDCKLWKSAEVERVHREFIASLHTRNTIRAKEKLEELNILVPLGESISLESHFELWLDVMVRSAIEVPEITDYCICNIVDSWASYLELFEDFPEATLQEIASFLLDTKCNLLEYHPDAKQVIKHLNKVADRYAEIANFNNAKKAEMNFYKVSAAKTVEDL